MIKSFEIENFRLFDHLKVNRLGRVNLVVGKNNAGKSAFLEAVLLHHTKLSMRVLSEFLHIRQEDRDASLLRESIGEMADPFRHFFKNHKIPELKQFGFRFSSGKNNEIMVKSGAYHVKDVFDEDKVLVNRRRVFIEGDISSEEDLQRCILVAENSDTSVLFDLVEGNSFFRRVRRGVFKNSGETYRFLPPQGVSDSLAASMWDMMGLSNMADEVIKGLRLIDPSIINIAFIENGEQVRDKERSPVAKLECFEEPVPLKSLGDGMTRVLHIILSLVSCKDGILIIDEFENGLHWEVQPKIWDLVFKLAKRLNVQVFASTHSRDCVAGFHEAWIDNEKEGAFLRLMHEENRKPVEEYSLEQLRKSIEINVEMR